ncbi:hypothetical protein [Isoptericola sp. QY 916]|uniref:hypothetical protein n=1 Tax=Isoptericola sp. QY 916 TaxID=2782570 RepID=UPI003D300557|nr:hypothetical protein [Isoptericola sp. QY 916]
MGTNGFTRADTGYLLSDQSGACAYGDLLWKPRNGAWRGAVAVACAGYDEDDLILEINYRPKRPSEPTIVYLVRGEIMARVDVNGQHSGQRFTHMQYRKTSGEPEITEPVPATFITVPLGPAIDDDLLRRVSREAAALLHVDTSALEWTPPPEGRPR